MAIEAFHIGAQLAAPPANELPDITPPDVSIQNMLRLQRDLLVVARIAYVKEYTRVPMGMFPASTGVRQWNSGARDEATGTVGYIASNNGRESVCDGRKFASPLYVAGGESIAVDFTPGPGSVIGLNADSTGSANDGRIRLRVFWEGFRRRPVA